MTTMCTDESFKLYLGMEDLVNRTLQIVIHLLYEASPVALGELV